MDKSPDAPLIPEDFEYQKYHPVDKELGLSGISFSQEPLIRKYTDEFVRNALRWLRQRPDKRKTMVDVID